MLRITDARTGETVAAAPARRGLTRVHAHVARRDATALRVLLVTDLLVRALELGGTPVWALLSGGRQEAELRADAAALGTHPLEDGRDAGAGPGEARAVQVVAEGGTAPDGVLVSVAPVDDLDSGAADPYALRLALLARPRGEAVRLDAAALDDARETLRRHRRAVADWARQPSRPVPEDVRAELRAAWEDDLDAPAVLRVLREVATGSGLPDGARFETYAYADRFLGLHLVRDLGSG
ncbi:hypothetical protein AB0G32_24785 [Streptomyces sp. NPDC023723]|uniref:hypothetical protein n=1 Tax=Streptomyces sp. NPDC023723 TaxID=3154323 RepID=UPI00340B137D